MTTSVAIPLGPAPHSCRWLEDALLSVKAQTSSVDVLIVDDMHGIGNPYDGQQNKCETMARLAETESQFIRDCVTVWQSPWKLGVAHAFNFGVALASHEDVLMLGADDVLTLDAVEEYEKCSSWDAPERRALTYYSLPLQYMDTGEVQFAPCNAAVVSKTFWRITGGFPVESASGAPDAAFLSQIWNSTEFMIKSVSDHPLYLYRRHDQTDTASKGPWQGVILESRNLLTQLFTPPKWGRYQ